MTNPTSTTRPVAARLSRPARLARLARAGALAALAGTTALAALPRVAAGQWSTVYEQFYLQAPHNWVFRDRYAHADRLFNAFDYGHAILYEELWNHPGASPARLEQQEYDYLTKQVLVRPPRVPLEEGAIEIRYAQLAPEAKAMFEWAHILHRQIYDVLADERLSPARKDAEVARLVAYYRSRRDLAFSSKPKSMALMQEQPYSLAFRQRYPKFNGLIWGYHWLQVGLYEPLVVGRDGDERQALVRATVARFWQMLADPPRTMPHQMPMTAAVAPTFAARYAEAAIIFDNLHSMHDVISDILANPSVPRDRKRAEILRAARLFRDDTSYVMPVEAWRTMAQHMGLENMGGPAVGFLPELPQPTVTYGAVMTHDDRTGAMTGFRYGSAVGGAHAAHGAGAAAPAPAPAAADPHAAHGAPAPGAAPRAAPRAQDTTAGMAMHHHQDSTGGMDMHAAHMAGDSLLVARLLADATVRARVRADTALRRELLERAARVSPAFRERVERQLTAPASPPRRATRRPTPARKPAAKPAPKPADPHAGHTMPAPAPKPAPRPEPDPHAGHRP